MFHFKFMCCFYKTVYYCPHLYYCPYILVVFAREYIIASFAYCLCKRVYYCLHLLVFFAREYIIALICLLSLQENIPLASCACCLCKTVYHCPRVLIGQCILRLFDRSYIQSRPEKSSSSKAVIFLISVGRLLRSLCRIFTACGYAHSYTHSVFWKISR